ncbi:Taurine import ATP-binding protein TauB [Variovorax sp. SRS16]|uniref:ABC transporter ATP-binding protein n=1 Tax=Variovorax sp. SRS16 TaxID=282217 RepID=UPI0013171917|nr:ABC transporter ATP-binding protein [Variovorax sp. SRS16]VTU22118.1 Taurine import ATP-binding protein TauB [Variovorax sp. SRS16]
METVETLARAPDGRPPSGGSSISFRGVTKRYPGAKGSTGATLALDDFNLEIASSEIFSIVGPTGCGKSTALNLVAGFEAVSAGGVYAGNHAVSEPGMDRAVVFQHPSLFPWLSVMDNVTLGLKCRGVCAAEREARATHLLREVGLSGFERHYPYQLSGGMQQRVQIARALISEPRVLLMDEPFGALDYQTRLMMQRLLLDLWKVFRPTIFFITHDVAEAIYISDHVVVMTGRPGKVKVKIEVTEPKPRSYQFLSSPEFVALQAKLLEAVQQAADAVHGGARSADRRMEVH